MATVTGKTSSKIDDLLGDMIVAGEINGSGQLILTSQDGSTQNAGTLSTPLGAPWSAATTYASGDVVGYAGALWRASAGNTNKPPARYTSVWSPITGTTHTDWVDKDPFFDGDALSASWDTTYHVGAPTASLTSISGEFETGTQALKIALAPSERVIAFQKVENTVRGGEIITVQVRAKVTSTSVGNDFYAYLMQSDDETLYPLASGVVETLPTESAQTLTTAWTTFTFTITAANAQPRAAVALIFRAAANAATMLVDWVRVVRSPTLTEKPFTLLDAYPVGSIHISVNSANPSTYFGGTWSAFGAGRMLVGVNASDPDYDTVQETGGAKTHVHDLDSSTSQALVRISTTDGKFAMKETAADTWQTTRSVDVGTIDTAYVVTTSIGARLRGNTVSESNVPPYITVYMWKRTA